MIATIWLPFPTVTVNDMYTVARGRKILSNDARAWKKAAGLTIMTYRHVPRQIECRVDIRIDIDESRNGDADSRSKIVVDSLVAAGVLKNDSKKHVRDVSIGWRPALAGGCIVTITEAPDAFEPLSDAAARVVASLEAKR